MGQLVPKSREETFYIETTNLTLGSLFDGIGGFPYAATFYGIEPLWASEIDPRCVSVTRRHFPKMAHVGDITKLDGRTLPPVDIITFGSPCQDLSMAGKRAGLQGERSSLFMDAIRIIYEMREATNGKYPRWAVWENVPGALSSSAGRDFQSVLAAFTKTEIPLPRNGKWGNAGMVRGDGTQFAWCVYNAQYFGVPQRRRRVFLVADFTGECAGEILFVPQSLSGYLAARSTARENPAAHVAGGTNPAITMKMRSGCEGGGKGPLFQTEKSATLATSNDQYLYVTVLNDQGGDSLNIEKNEQSPTLRSQTHGNLLVVVHPSISGTLCASGAGTSHTGGIASETDFCVVEPTYAIQGMTIGRKDSNGPRGLGVNEGACYTLTATDRHATCYTQSSFGGFQPGVGTIVASGGSNGGGSENLVVTPPPPTYIVRRLTPTECERLQGFPDDWTAEGHDGKPMSDTARYMMLGNSVAVPCVAYIMQGIVAAHGKAGG